MEKHACICTQAAQWDGASINCTDAVFSSDLSVNKTQCDLLLSCVISAGSFQGISALKSLSPSNVRRYSCKHFAKRCLQLISVCFYQSEKPSLLFAIKPEAWHVKTEDHWTLTYCIALCDAMAHFLPLYHSWIIAMLSFLCILLFICTGTERVFPGGRKVFHCKVIQGLK